MNTISEAIESCAILKQASPASQAALLGIAGIKQLKKGEHLFFDKQDVTRLFFSLSGNFSLYKLSSTGEKKVIFVYGAGHMLNEVMLQDLPSSINCEAFSDADALYFPKDEFARIMSEDFGLTRAVMDSMATKIRRLYRQLKNTPASVRGDKKLAAKLWKLSLDHGEKCTEGTRISLNLTVTYLADMLGAKRETVSRQLKSLSDMGLILQRDSGFIIPDREKLMNYFQAP